MSSEALVKIKVIGVGGAGGNAINDMIESGVVGVEYIAANTDAQDLAISKADLAFQLGEKLTRGLGAGANPDMGRQAAEEDLDKINSILENTDMLFITAGMGGGTGTGAAPIIAKVAKEMGILTIGIVTKPFGFEGRKRKENAEKGVQELKQYVDTLVIIPNDKLTELPDKNITLQNAFKEANNVLKIGITGVADLILQPGLINLDFADIRTTMQGSGMAMLGFGYANGENRAIKATEQALSSPLLEKSIEGASKILLNICGNAGLGLNESYEISNKVREAAGKSADDVMFGTVIDDSLEDGIKVTIVATSFTGMQEKIEEKIQAEAPSVEISKEGDRSEKVENVKKAIDESDLDVPSWIRRNR